jgi:preprotein translocase subunit SecA
MFKWFSGLVDSNEREIKKLQPVVDEINKLEPVFQALSEEALREKTAEFKKRVTDAASENLGKLESLKTELGEAQKCQREAVFDDKEAYSDQCKEIQSGMEALEKNLKKQQNEALGQLLPEAFAAVREAARRSLGQRHYDVQLIGGMVLHHGKIAEMRTGEGKTLVATLPLYLNSLTGRGVHLVTVNDYLARRDPYWMGPIFHALGVSVASIYPMQSAGEHQPAMRFDPSFDSEKEADPWRHFRPIPRKEAYLADITYGTSAEFGFDYLRDNMAQDLSQMVQRELNYAIVDEVDNLLIDEARTPLIISAPDTESSQRYQVFSRLVQGLKSGQDYEVKEKEHSVEPTDDGFSRVEQLTKREGMLTGDSLYDPHNSDLMRHLRNALSAKELYRRDREYVVKDGEIVIVDEFTGRLMLGRRYSEGLHQAIEAKEGVKVQQESKTFATITIQNYFRMYDKLAGMTGTAETEAEEFSRIYKLEVVVIPTHKEIMREDQGDLIYKDEKSKFKALANEIEEVNKTGRPILVGTVSIEKNKELSDMLSRRGVKHSVLNAKNHLKEAEIIARAGEEGAVTVATNMAGRGVDIILGGRPPEDSDEKARQAWQERHNKIVGMGGLHVIGSERHEARRIDNQLRGRAGRQGDPGSSRFFVALDDDIMRKFGGERVQSIMNWAGMDENTPIENKLISRSIENAQIRVEGYHFDMRKHIVDYDDVINKQRAVIYSERRKILAGADLRSNILNMVKEEIEDAVSQTFNVERGAEPDFAALIGRVSAIFPVPTDVTSARLAALNQEEIQDLFVRAAEDQYAAKEREIPEGGMRVVERLVMLRIIDTLWVEHLTAIDNLRQGIGLRAVGQQDPLVAYRGAASEMFQELLSTIRGDVARTIFRVSVTRQEGGKQVPSKPVPSPMTKVMGQPHASASSLPASGHKTGRNDPCTCGSGKKYKHCCGK